MPKTLKTVRLLALAPVTKGLGFAVLEGPHLLIDCGVKSVGKERNPDSLVKTRAMLEYYRPDVVVLENCLLEESRRSARIQALTQEIVALANAHKIRTVLFAPEQVREVFFGREKGTKQERAIKLAGYFSEELTPRLPPKRRPWMSEDYRMSIFDAVALGWVFYMKKAKAKAAELPDVLGLL